MRLFIFLGSLLFSVFGLAPGQVGLVSERNLSAYSAGPEMIAQPVFVTRTGTRYHHCQCRMVENPVKAFVSVQAAIQAGYSACHFCSRMIAQDMGPCSSVHQALVAGGQAGSSSRISTGRCRATTQKGTQCSRNDNGVSAYCWQHSR